MMKNIYDNLGTIIGDLNFVESVIDTMLLNGKNAKANRHLQEARIEVRHALSDLSDALFEISTSPTDENEVE